VAQTAQLHVEPGHGSHLLVRRGDRKSVLPMHGSAREMPTGTVEAIKRDLGLKGER
jgi:mRNA interferase HicA